MLTIETGTIDANDSRGVYMTKTVGQLIRERREELGLTQWQLYEMTGVRQHYISQIERGKVQYPGLDILASLGDVLGIEMDEFKRAMGWAITIHQVVVQGEGEGVMLPVRGLVPADSVRFTSHEGASMSEIKVVDTDIEGARSPFGLEVTGDCFKSIGILSGDVVIVEAAEGREPQDRQLVVVRVGDEVTLKRWTRREDGVVHLLDGDGLIVHRIDPDEWDDVEVIALYVTFKPLSPR